MCYINRELVTKYILYKLKFRGGKRVRTITKLLHRYSLTSFSYASDIDG